MFASFHNKLDQRFEKGMVVRERMIIGILLYLRHHGFDVNATNLNQYAPLFASLGSRRCCSGDGDCDEASCVAAAAEDAGSRLTGVNILVNLGDLTRSDSFPTRRTFHEAYRNSVFCPIPPGDVPHVSRFFHAVLCGCIPVVISFPGSSPGTESWHQEFGAAVIDSYPFPDDIDYDRLVVRIPAMFIDNLVEALLDISLDVIREKQEYIALVRNLFIHDYFGQVKDAFSLQLLEILRRLPHAASSK